MKFTFKGKEYRICFQHNTSSFDKLGNRQDRATFCTIYETGLKDRLIAEEEALCHDNDNFSRAVGRKISLARALALASADKEFRRTAWMAYFNRNNDPTTKGDPACQV